MLVLAIAPLSARSMWLVNALTVQLVPLALMFRPRAVRHTASGRASSSQRLRAELQGATLPYVTLQHPLVNAPVDHTDCFHQSAPASLHSKRLRLWGTTQYPAAFSPSASHCLTVQPCGFAAVLAGSEGTVARMVRCTRCESHPKGRGDRMAHA